LHADLGARIGTVNHVRPTARVRDVRQELMPRLGDLRPRYSFCSLKELHHGALRRLR
jgi:hypothetical protein